MHSKHSIIMFGKLIWPHTHKKIRKWMKVCFDIMLNYCKANKASLRLKISKTWGYIFILFSVTAYWRDIIKFNGYLHNKFLISVIECVLKCVIYYTICLLQYYNAPIYMLFYILLKSNVAFFIVIVTVFLYF